MPEVFNVILVSVSRLLFSSPAFVKMAETSLSGARRVQDSSGELCSSHASVGSSPLDLFREVPVSDTAHQSPPLLEAVATRLSSHDLGCSNSENLGQSPGFKELSAIASSPTSLGPKSSTGGDIKTSLGDDTSVIVSESYDPLNDSDDDMILALNSFSLSSSSPPGSTITGTLQSSNGSGLGISGLTRKDGSGSFDGLGLVSIKSSPWRQDDPFRDQANSASIQGVGRRRPSFFSSCSTYDGSSVSDDFGPSLIDDTGDTGISDVFLQETLLTFTQDPFHQLCHNNVVKSTSITDCDNDNKSWSEFCLGLGDELASTSTSMSELLTNDTIHSSDDESRPLNYRRRRIPKVDANFSSATISSELKRLSAIVLPKSNWRNRSSSWPSSNTEDTAATTPLPRYKWRL